MISVDRFSYYEAQPFPHCVIDDFYDEAELREVLREWPDEPKMMVKQRPTSIKAQNWMWGDFGPATQRILRRLNSASFLKELERLTGLSGLLADPDLKGGGLHEIPPGGFLDTHIDFNWHPSMKAARKINLLLYLNEGWEWNGDLVLSDMGGVRTRKKIAPSFNRCVIFNTTDHSWHGHPEPLSAPRSRKSIALYYYRVEPKPEKVRSTVYVRTEGGQRLEQRMGISE